MRSHVRLSSFIAVKLDVSPLHMLVLRVRRVRALRRQLPKVARLEHVAVPPHALQARDTIRIEPRSRAVQRPVHKVALNSAPALKVQYALPVPPAARIHAVVHMEAAVRVLAHAPLQVTVHPRATNDTQVVADVLSFPVRHAVDPCALLPAPVRKMHGAAPMHFAGLVEPALKAHPLLVRDRAAAARGARRVIFLCCAAVRALGLFPSRPRLRRLCHPRLGTPGRPRRRDAPSEEAEQQQPPVFRPPSPDQHAARAQGPIAAAMFTNLVFLSCFSLPLSPSRESRALRDKK
jgi:hypothetical protein